MGWYYACRRVIQKVNGACLAVACVVIALMAVLTLWEVITRYFFRQPAMWTFPVTSYMLLYSIMLAAAYTLQKGGHVSVEVLVELLPATPRRWLQRLAHLLGLAFILVFLYQSTRHTLRVLQEGTKDISTLSVPLWIPSSVMTFGLALMVVTYVFILIDSFLEKEGHQLPEGTEGTQQAAGGELD